MRKDSDWFEFVGSQVQSELVLALVCVPSVILSEILQHSSLVSKTVIMEEVASVGNELNGFPLQDQELRLLHCCGE